jgi:very-short-patch-repair endonuclease
MSKNKIVPYKYSLKEKARQLRKNSTFSEIRLWKAIRKKQLGTEFHRQVPIDRYIVDFFSHEYRFAIEIDGSSHNDKLENDKLREKRLVELGIKVVRFTEAEVKDNLEGVLFFIKEKLEECESV